MGTRETIYASYGVTGHEYRPVYATGALTEAYDELTVEIPGCLKQYETAAGAKCYELEGRSYMLDELLCATKDDDPGITWCDDRGRSRLAPLSVVQADNR